MKIYSLKEETNYIPFNVVIESFGPKMFTSVKLLHSERFKTSKTLPLTVIDCNLVHLLTITDSRLSDTILIVLTDELLIQDKLLKLEELISTEFKEL